MFGLSTLATKAIIIAVLCVISASAGAWITHKIDLSSYEKLELSYAKAQAEAIIKAQTDQLALDKLAQDAAKKQANDQLTARLRVQQQLRDLQKYVKNRSTDCYTYGFVRLLDSQIHSISPERLLLPPGKSDDTCTDFTTTSLAQALSNIINASTNNSAQLNNLIDFIRTAQAQIEKNK